MRDVIEEAEWWMHPENIQIAGRCLVDSGADGETVFQFFAAPWEFTEFYVRAWNSILEPDCGT